jgi:hypothetical protein
VTLPVYRLGAVHDCWICTKFSKWLEAENPALFKAWQKQSLQVKFTSFGRMRLEQPREDILLPFFVNILPPGGDDDDDGAACEVVLNFMYAQGRCILL